MTQKSFLKFMVTGVVVALFMIALMGCSVGARVERGIVANDPPYHRTEINSQHESFLKLVLFIRKHAGSKPSDDLVLTAQTHMVNSGMIRKCRQNECFFVYDNKEIVIDPEFIEIRKVGSKDYVKFFNIEVAMKVIYGIKD